MELAGEQKRIQALFSELRLAEEQTVPRFATVWNRAQARTLRPARAFNLSFVAATALLVCALASLAVWSKYSQPKAPAAVAGTITASGFANPATEKTVFRTPAEQKSNRSSSISRARRLAAQKQALLLAINRRAARDAKVISSWESPTASLLKSQNDELLKSIPQLNENADELKSFLPNKPK
jgi:uncharacterized membrane protein